MSVSDLSRILDVRTRRDDKPPRWPIELGSNLKRRDNNEARRQVDVWSESYVTAAVKLGLVRSRVGLLHVSKDK
jgi:hypothetical protein